MNIGPQIDHNIGSEQESWLVRQRDPAADEALNDARVFLSGAGDYDQLSDEARTWIDLLEETAEPASVDEASI
jgi:hypothetical protein